MLRLLVGSDLGLLLLQPHSHGLVRAVLHASRGVGVVELGGHPLSVTPPVDGELALVGVTAVVGGLSGHGLGAVVGDAAQQRRLVHHPGGAQGAGVARPTGR